MDKKIFTTESVGVGHPDKVADKISDFVLSEYLKNDKNSKVACETLVTTNKVVLAGEINSKIKLNLTYGIKKIIKDIGYDYEGSGFEPSKIDIMNLLHQQSNDISIGVTDGGAGDQGMMFGYACDETDSFLPLQVCYAHDLLKELNKYVGKGIILPDSKSQITMTYENGVPKHIDTILISQQNTELMKSEDFKKYITEIAIDKVIKSDLFDKNSKILINPTGKFLIGGPNGDTGLTGRKIIVDTYGGFGYHGGGAFSGKDPSKVDRSGAYMARWLAKNIVNKGYTSVANVQLSYAIGLSYPMSVMVTDNKGQFLEDATKWCQTVDLTPNGIINRFNLKDIDYTKFCNYSHFYHKTAPWEIL